ncbi:hypothetical protein [Corynebacterium afermentans]|nr:hypothetical protein [Corynebacterium afermentans]
MSRLFVFTATGWLAPVEGPEHDGAYQLNVRRLRRLHRRRGTAR